MKKAKERVIKSHYHFVDFKSAFDTIRRKPMRKILRSIVINKKVISVVEKIYDKSICAAVVDGLLLAWFSVSVGVRQGCLLSPTLFNLFLDFVMDEIKCLQDRITLDKDLKFDGRYSDDTTLIAAVFERLELATDQPQEACKKYGMNINTGKWKVISVSATNLTVETEEIKIVKEFKFLWSSVPYLPDDVKRRIALANSAFDILKKNVWLRECMVISVKLKPRLFNALILPIDIYGTET